MKRYIILGYLFIWFSQIFAAGGERRLVDLRGHWRFEIGDNMNWAKVDFDDSKWRTIFAPSEWENEGFPGYDGYAWYRKKFILPNLQENSSVYVHIGRIDDVDEVYINGHRVGLSGGFPPDYNTAYSKFREYLVPLEFLNFSEENVIAVRVFDEGLEGGILEGRLGLFEVPNVMPVELDLSGHWQFRTGDNSDWAATDVDESDWDTLMVPLHWDMQGYQGYDGYAWYRKKFTLPTAYQGKALVLLLGLIDDIDQTFLNGHKIGETGEFYDYVVGENPVRGDEWVIFRAYKVPFDLLNFGSENQVAIRVYDAMLDGGIYKGPIGITSRENYESHKVTETPPRRRLKFWEWVESVLFSPRER